MGVLCISLSTLSVAAYAEQDSSLGCGVLTSLNSLPVDINHYLLEKTGGLADKGAAFNKGDVFDYSLPSQRFMLAAVCSDEVIVAIEHGGRPYGNNTFGFQKKNNVWTFVNMGKTSIGYVPTTATGLIEQHRLSAH